MAVSHQRIVLPPSPNTTSFGNDLYQQLHRPAPAAGFAEQKTVVDRKKHDSLAPDIIAPQLKKRTSRFGLASLFSKHKAAGDHVQQGRLGSQVEEDESPDGPPVKDNGIAYTTGRTSFSEEISALPVAEGTTLKHRSSKVALRSKSSFKKDSAVWHPPPLFQAYPQAVRHALLHVPTLSAEAILRANAGGHSGARRTPESHSSDSTITKAQKEKKLKKQTVSDMLAKANWIDKVFVLVTSGYFLQYTGTGAFDRLPEKIMPLSKDSAAFASDAVPGKPYVLQISQVSAEDGTVDTEASRSMFKKLGLRMEMRRSASSFLLVLDNPEEMSSWLVAVRKEIQAMGGKEYNPDEFKRRTSTERPQLQQKPSQRYMVKRDPHRFSEKPWEPPSDLSFSSDADTKTASRDDAETPTPATVQRHPSVTELSIGSRSLSNATSSINQSHLDRLKESPRQSYASTDVGTLATSQASSPAPSPHEAVFDFQDQAMLAVNSQTMASTYIGAAQTSTDKQPAHTAQRRDTLRPQKSQPLPQQASGYTQQHRRTPSPAAPNFSVPTFSKRYSTASSPSPVASATSKCHSPAVPIQHDASAPLLIEEESNVLEKRTSTLGELQSVRKASPRVIKPSPAPDANRMPGSRASSFFHDRPSSSESDARFARRFSSLDYSRGVSPLQLGSQPPAPHPPPSTALPPIPNSSPSQLASHGAPPTAPLPAIPMARVKHRYSMMPSSTASPTVSKLKRPSSSSSADTPRPPSSFASARHEPTVGSDSNPTPMSAFSITRHSNSWSQVPVLQEHVKSLADTRAEESERAAAIHHERRASTGGTAKDSSLQPTVVSIETPKAESNKERLTPFLNFIAPSPPKPTRAPPPPPPVSSSTTESERPSLEFRKSMQRFPRIGREPPPVPSPAERPRSRISISSPAESYFDAPAPHPFIPPIKVSERKFRGSIDGPWNPTYSGPQRTFFDLSVG